MWRDEPPPGTEGPELQVLPGWPPTAFRLRDGQHRGGGQVLDPPGPGELVHANGCPAVYDIDVLPEYLAIQGEQADAEVMARLENLLPGETAVIKREVVEEALRTLLAEGSKS